MHRLLRTSSRGMTLLEALIYVALLVLLLTAIIGLFVSMMRSYGALIVARHINESATIGMERMMRDIRAASSVDAASILNANPGQLTLLSGATTTMFSLVNGSLRVRENGIDIGSLTLPDVSVDTLMFEKITSSSILGVRIQLILTATSSVGTKSESFEDFAVLRGAY